jgi:hypothetical protein
MVVWVESQSSMVIAVLVFAACYGLAAVIFAASVIASRWPAAAHLKATTPGILSPLGTITGLLIAFLAVRVWANFDHASAYIAQEASAVREAVLLSELLPGDMGNAVCNGAKTYLEFAETEDWPAMAEGRASLRRLPPGLLAALRSLVSFMPATPGQKIAQQRAVVAIEQALEARRNRILLSEAAIAPIQWFVILTLDGLMLVTFAMMHIDRPPTAIFSMLVMSTAIAVSLVLLMVYDRPFGSGGITLQPVALREIKTGDTPGSITDLCKSAR